MLRSTYIACLKFHTPRRATSHYSLQSAVYRNACYLDSSSFTAVIPIGMFPNLRSPIYILPTFCVFNLFPDVDSNLIHNTIHCSVLLSLTMHSNTFSLSLKLWRHRQRPVSQTCYAETPYLMCDCYLLTVRVSRRPSGDRLIRGMAYQDWSMIQMNVFWDRTRGVGKVQAFRSDLLSPSSGKKELISEIKLRNIRNAKPKIWIGRN